MATKLAEIAADLPDLLDDTQAACGAAESAPLRAEAASLGIRQRFEEMDANKDGQLSRSELEAGVL